MSEKEKIGTVELNKKVQEIIYDNTNIKITLKESDEIVKDIFNYIKKEAIKGNEVQIYNFCKFLVKENKSPRNDGYYKKPTAVFSANFLKGGKNES